MKSFTHITSSISLALAISFGTYTVFKEKILLIVSFFATLLIYFIFYKLVLYFSDNSFELINKVIFYLSRKYNYIIEKKYVKYTYVDMENMELERNYEIKLKRGKMNRYDEKFRWSASLNDDIEILSTKNNEEITNIHDDYSWKKYTIDLNHTYTKGESFQTGSKVLNLVDHEHKAQTFFSTNIKEKIQLLIITVKIPKKFNPKNGKFVIKNKDQKEILVKDLVYDDNFNGYKYEVNFPRKNFVYSIIWTF